MRSGRDVPVPCENVYFELRGKGASFSRADVKIHVRRSPLWIAATGELFLDPNALDHLRAAVALGHRVAVLSHGQMFTPQLLDQVLEIGVRTVRMSCDSIDPVQYRKIRRGGELSRILDAASYLQEQKKKYKDLRVEITCTLLSNTFNRQKEFESFWSDKVDRLLFNVEYYDVFKYRRTFHNPAKRHNCEIKTYVVPSGHIAPCCAITVYQHEGDTSWLPHVDTHTLAEAYEQLCDMYEDPQSPLSRLCRKCDWWIMWAPNKQANGSGYFRYVDFERPNPTAALSVFSRFWKAVGQIAAVPFQR